MVRDRHALPPSTPLPVPPVWFVALQPKSWVIVGGSVASTRLFMPSQPGSDEKYWWTCTRFAVDGDWARATSGGRAASVASADTARVARRNRNATLAIVTSVRYPVGGALVR